ncbi:MAG TPA: sigma 54-interacting transcriptional regulator [Myxococcales bacterium]|nr:sigma 54-interacting transcriptional regulator [Myxococcales bacterium]
MPRTIATVHSEIFPGAEESARAELLVIDGPDRGRAAVLRQSAVVAGSDPSCQLVLSDERVSRRHLEITPSDGRFVVRDLGSTNGTLYEGSLVSEVRVGLGATFRVGHSFLRIQPVARPLDIPPSQARRCGELVAESLAMREVFAVLELAARSDVTVLVEGETGTGKELAARALHDGSSRRRGPFVAVDCGALPETLLESELFGHVKGAFTGASGTRAGAFQRASGGTLFLDELAQVSPAAQARLLRVIEERRVRPVGADAEREVDVRLIAAASGDLSSRVAEGSFRSDLFYRLSVVRVRLPPLRSRREDIAPIVTELLRRRGLEAAGPIEGPGADLLRAHSWPGNVRELRNTVDRAFALSPGARSFAELHISLESAGGDEAVPVRADLEFSEAKAAVLHAFEARYLRDLLGRCEGNISQAAREAGLDRKHLRTLLRRHGLVPAAPTEDDSG